MEEQQKKRRGRPRQQAEFVCLGVDVNKALLDAVRRQTVENNTTLRESVEEALRNWLAQDHASANEKVTALETKLNAIKKIL